MRQLNDLTANVTITNLLNVNTDQDMIRAIQRTLDGQYYVQIIGQPAAVVNLDITVDLDGKTALLAAETNGDELEAIWENGAYQGYIIDRGEFAKMGAAYFTTTVKLGVVTS